VSDGQPVPGPGIDTVGIAVGNPPVVTIGAPLDGDIHQAGDTVSLIGSADDSEDGPISPSALHWQIVFHHRSHTHPFIDDLVGSPQSFVWATAGEPDWVVSYEVILSATDSDGLTGSASVFVVPQLTDFVLGTDPPGLELHLDGQPITTPLTVTGVVGYPRTIEAPSPLAGGTQSWLFSQWSDGGAAVHDIVTPAAPATYTATYTNACAAPTVIPPGGATVAGTTSGTNTLAGTCAATDAAPEQVFAWTPAISGTATIQTCGGATNFDTVLYLRNGSCGTGTQIACNDDTTACSSASGANHGSRITPTVTAGQTYYIVVDGINGVHAAGNFTLTVVAPVLATTSTTSTSSTSSSSSGPPTTSTSSTSTSTNSTAPPTTTSSTAVVTTTSSTTSTTGTAPTTSSTTTSTTSTSSRSTTSTSSTSVSTTSSTSTTEPLCGNGVLDPGEQCDDGNHVNNDCCTSRCTAALRGTPCGDGGRGDCDAPDSCDAGGHCLANHVAAGTPCADDGEVCTADRCGADGACLHLPGNAGTECRAKGTNDECDAGDVCDGVSPSCPLAGVELGCTTDLPTELAGKMIPVTCETQGGTGAGDASSCEAVGFEVTSATVAAAGRRTIARPLEVGRQVTRRAVKFGKGILGADRRLVLRLRLNALGKRLLRQQGQLRVLVAVRVQSGAALRDIRRLVTLRR
jgi:cysteine-rich repeat protein